MTSTNVSTTLSELCSRKDGSSGNYDLLYGFKLNSGKEVILERKNDDGVSVPDYDKFSIDLSKGIIKIQTMTAMPWGQQVPVIEVIDVSDVSRIIVFYEPGNEKHELGSIKLS